ncbi:MAG: hypothetical protein HC850_11065 [Rhodomicrobium sp.]|nr:hypothetical protein [Rhodomicrobium sp.]
MKGFQLFMEIGKRSGREDIDAPEQMVRRPPFIEIEFVEQRPLIRRLPPHHRTAPTDPLTPPQKGNTVRSRSQSSFSTVSGEKLRGVAALAATGTCQISRWIGKADLDAGQSRNLPGRANSVLPFS